MIKGEVFYEGGNRASPTKRIVSKFFPPQRGGLLLGGVIIKGRRLHAHSNMPGDVEVGETAIACQYS